MSIYKYRIFIFALMVTAAVSVPSATHAASPKISGWIPYWMTSSGTESASNHLDELDIIHPFSFTVNADGTLKDTAKLKGDDWQDLFDEARDEDVDVIPSILWNNGQQIDKILGSRKSRAKHIKAIVDAVKKGKYDGIDIDYESKLAATKDDFSTFVKELKKALGRKTLVCTIEARTPPESLYRTMPSNIAYANDFKQIGKYCDIVQLMTYDQGRADFKLNDAKSGTPYIPVADADWVRKVAQLAVKDIPKSKIMLGAPTYGYEYQVAVSPNWFQSYIKLHSVNTPLALSTAAAYGATPSRNKAGEVSYSYFPTNALAPMLPYIAIPAGTPPGDVAAQQALAYANLTGQTVTFNEVWWSDAQAIADKLDIVDDFDLRGLAIFKIDGEEDQELWNILD